MHETAVAQSIFETILAETIKQNAKPVRAKISCGMLTVLNDELLFEAFEAIAGTTVCEGMKLEIEHKPIRGQCKDCNEIFEFDISHPACSKCDGKDFVLLPDEPLVLETIEFQVE